jgi:hypothetical protein
VLSRLCDDVPDKRLFVALAEAGIHRDAKLVGEWCDGLTGPLTFAMAGRRHTDLAATVSEQPASHPEGDRQRSDAGPGGRGRPHTWPPNTRLRWPGRAAATGASRATTHHGDVGRPCTAVITFAFLRDLANHLLTNG